MCVLNFVGKIFVVCQKGQSVSVLNFVGINMNLPLDKFVATCKLGFENLLFVSLQRVSPEEVSSLLRSSYMQYTRVLIELATEFLLTYFLILARLFLQ